MTRTMTLISVGVIVVLFATIGYLYQRAARFDPVAYTIVFNAVNSLQKADAQLVQDVLLLRSGILKQYDSLNHAVGFLYEQVEILKSNEAVIPFTDMAGLSARIENTRNVISRNEQIIEDIKSDSALLRNSLSYLGKIVSDLADSEQFTPEEALQYTTFLNQLVQIVRNSEGADIEAVQQVLDSIGAAQGDKAAMPLEDQLVTHARVVLAQLVRLDKNIHLLLQHPITTVAGELENAFIADFTRARRVADNYRSAVFLAVVILIIFVTYVMLRLQRTAALLAESNRQLQSSEQRVRTVVEHAADSILLHDVFGKLVEVNRQACKSLGYTRQELLQMTIFDIEPESQPRLASQEWSRVLEGKMLTRDRMYRRSNGELFPVELRLAKYEVDDELLVLVLARDVTERRHAERELKRHRDNLEQLVAERTATISEQARIIDQIHDSVVTIDLDGMITSWNRGAERLFGYTGAEAMGQHISLVYPQAEHELFERKVIEPLKQNGIHEVEVQMRRKSGELFTAHVSSSMQYGEEGTPKGFISYSLDVTARKHAEELARKRTSQLAALNKELETFSYSVSHDLRAPLRAIAGFSEALREDYADQLDETAQDFLNRIQSGATRMGQLIDDLLKLSRVSQEKMHKENVDFSLLVRKEIDLRRDNEPGRDVAVDIAPDVVVYGDKGLLALVAQNLIDNAWKYTRNEATARIEFSVQTKEVQQILCVSDNGVGFDAKYADKVFGAFQRLHRAEEFEGTGIGLATVQRIIHRHGGEIWAESEPGKGARICFTL